MLKKVINHTCFNIINIFIQNYLKAAQNYILCDINEL